jgi:methionyl aminopeptidase
MDGLRAVGRILANTLQGMAPAMQPGMTTRELDGIGRALVQAAGAQSAP